MKKTRIGLVHLVFIMVIVLFLNVSFTSCNMKANVVLNGKDHILEKLKVVNVPTVVYIKSDTSKIEDGKVDTKGNNELIGDFRYDYLLK
jgi:hypothetical protein